MAEIIDIADKLPPQDPYLAEAVSIVFDRLDVELRAGLGLDLDFPDDEETPLFDFVQGIYDEANDGCWFCDSRIDPNENHKSARLCFMCEYKLKKLMEIKNEGRKI